MQGESQCFMSIMMIKIKTTVECDSEMYHYFVQCGGGFTFSVQLRKGKFKEMGYSMLIIFYKANIRYKGDTNGIRVYIL